MSAQRQLEDRIARLERDIARLERWATIWMYVRIVLALVWAGIVGTIVAHFIILEAFPKCEIEIYPGHIEEKRALFHPVPGRVIIIHSPCQCDIRNAIIAQRVNTLIAAPAQHHEILRSGTWQTVRMFGGPNRAHSITNRPMYIITPDGIFTTYRDDFITEMNSRVRAQEGLI